MRPGYLDRRGPDPVLICCLSCGGDGLLEFPRRGCCPEHCLCADLVPCEDCHGTGLVQACPRCQSRPEPGDGLLCPACELAVELAEDLDAYRADLQLEMRRSA
jgi:hypothetical protein